MTQDTHSPLSFANHHALRCYFSFNRFCFEWERGCFQLPAEPRRLPCATDLAPEPGLGREGPASPASASLVWQRWFFPLAVINEVLLMDFWLAFSRHLARS